MAILFEEENRKKGGLGWLIILIIIVFLAAATYFLFFTPTPFIEVVVPSRLESISKISKIKLDTSNVINSPVYQSLKEQTPRPERGEAGRENPFRPY